MKEYKYLYRTGTNRHDWRVYQGKLEAVDIVAATARAQRLTASKGGELVSVELVNIYS